MAYEMKHPSEDHSLDNEDHADCVELAEELLHDLADKGYPEHVVDLVKGLVCELKEYTDGEDDDEDDTDGDGKQGDDNAYEAKDEDGHRDGNPDDELNKFAEEEMKKHGVKPIATIRIGVKEKK